MQMCTRGLGLIVALRLYYLIWRTCNKVFNFRQIGDGHFNISNLQVKFT